MKGSCEETILSECTLQIRVRYPECDPMGYLHHARYLEYFELGRTELLRNSGFSYRDMESKGEFFVVARAEVKFSKPARYDDELQLRTMMVRLTRAKIEHAYRLYRGKELLCTGLTTIACVDREGHLSPIPEYFWSAE